MSSYLQIKQVLENSAAHRGQTGKVSKCCELFVADDRDQQTRKRMTYPKRTPLFSSSQWKSSTFFPKKARNMNFYVKPEI